MISGLILKAEAAFAVQLVTRHRTPRLAAVLVTAVVIVAAKAALPEVEGGLTAGDLVLGLVVVQGALVGSRLSTPAALAAARAAGAPASAVVIGRLAGATAVVSPVLLVQATVAVPLTSLGGVLAIAMVLAVSSAAASMAVSRWLGATLGGFLAGIIGIVGLWVLGAWPSERVFGSGHVDAAGISVIGLPTESWGSVALVIISSLACITAAVLSVRERPYSLEPLSRVSSHYRIGAPRARRR